MATIEFAEKIKVGSGKLHIKYTGILNDNLKGFYRSKYTNPAGEVKYGAITQFEVKLIIFFFKKIQLFEFVLSDALGC